MDLQKKNFQVKQNVKKWSILLIIFLTACLALMFSYIKYVSKHNAIEVYAEEVVPEVSNDTYTSANFKKYQKGMKEVNILFNFINYKDDETNQFTSTEIENILLTFSNDLQVYFDIMSQDYLDINIDYCCYTTNYTYNYYLDKPEAEYSTELNLFLNGVNGRLDYDGTQKTYDFNEYNVMVNCFAGNSGDWNTFLWPHAYPEMGLIMMMEYKQGYLMASSTMCHELLHVFGVMDLYAYQGDQWFSAQYLDMMGSSNKNTPTNAYFRNKIGWIDISDYGDATTTAIEEISNEQKGSLTLDLYPRATSDFSKTIAYKFGENENNGEYFVAEYRVANYGPNSFDSFGPETGVVVYRVNEKASSYGNAYGNHTGNYYNEVIFMGNSTIDISNYLYTESCVTKAGNTRGNKGNSVSHSLVYSSAGGKANLFNGENSEISIYVNSTNTDYATITITFAEDEDIPQKQQIDLSGVQWSTASFNYNGTQRSVGLKNLPSTVSANYSGTISAINAGVYRVSVTLSYDEEKYELINQNFDSTCTWMINAEFVTIKIENKTSVYGSNLKSLTYSIIGTIHNNDDLNINLQKEEGLNVGTYAITCTAENDNYDIYIQNGTYTITPRVVKVKVNDQEFYLDEFVNVDQNDYTIISGSDSLLQGDLITVIPVNLDDNVAGTYDLIATINNSNYDLQVENGVLVLKDREIISDQPSNDSQNDFMNKTTIIIVIGSISVVLTGIGVGFVVRRKKREKFERSLFKIDYNKLDNNDRRRY